MNALPSLAVPARGPIRLDYTVPATSQTCGVRFEVRLNTTQADEVRAAARLLDLPTGEFIEAALSYRLPHQPPRREENLALLASRAGMRLSCDDPVLLERLERAAAYTGQASARDYLIERLSTELWCTEADMVVHPATGQPVGNAALWQRVTDLLTFGTGRYVADPLEHPGFLARFPECNPRLHFGPHQVLDDPCLEPASTQAHAA